MNITARKYDEAGCLEMICVECSECREHDVIWLAEETWRDVVDLDSPRHPYYCAACWEGRYGMQGRAEFYGIPEDWQGWISIIHHEHGKTTITRTYSESGPIPF